VAGEEQLGRWAAEPSKYAMTFGEIESQVVGSQLRWRMFQPLLHRLNLRHKISAWASGSPAFRVVFRSFSYICRVRVVFGSFAAGAQPLAHIATFVTNSNSN
jgi:hypothetical protein